eukprot:1371774-Rhodomonas_salina.1
MSFYLSLSACISLSSLSLSPSLSLSLPIALSLHLSLARWVALALSPGVCGTGEGAWEEKEGRVRREAALSSSCLRPAHALSRSLPPLLSRLPLHASLLSRRCRTCR